MAICTEPACIFGNQKEELLQRELLQLTSEIQKSGGFNNEVWVIKFAVAVSAWKSYEIVQLLKNKKLPEMDDEKFKNQAFTFCINPKRAKKQHSAQKEACITLAKNYKSVVTKIEVHLREKGYNF